jgi:hypothetical protein
MLEKIHRRLEMKIEGGIFGIVGESVGGDKRG